MPDFNDMYELYDPCTVMFFFRNKHIMIDLGTGNNNKISWAFNNKQEVRAVLNYDTIYIYINDTIQRYTAIVCWGIEPPLLAVKMPCKCFGLLYIFCILVKGCVLFSFVF